MVAVATSASGPSLRTTLNVLLSKLRFILCEVKSPEREAEHFPEKQHRALARCKVLGAWTRRTVGCDSVIGEHALDAIDMIAIAHSETSCHLIGFGDCGDS